jgi:hypothetical protein
MKACSKFIPGFLRGSRHKISRVDLQHTVHAIWAGIRVFPEHVCQYYNDIPSHWNREPNIRSDVAKKIGKTGWSRDYRAKWRIVTFAETVHRANETTLEFLSSRERRLETCIFTFRGIMGRP